MLHKLGEAKDLFLNLISQFASVAQDHSAACLRILRNRLENRKNKNSGLAHTRDSLAKHIVSKDSDWNAALLNVGGMLKTAISDALEQLTLQQHIFERCGVDTGVCSGLGSTVLVFILGTFVKVLFKNVFFVVGELVVGGFAVNHFVSMEIG